MDQQSIDKDNNFLDFDFKCENLVMEMEKKITTTISLNEVAEKVENEEMMVENLQLNLMTLDEEFYLMLDLP